MSEIYILGVKINDISLDETVSKIKDLLSGSQKGYIVTPNPEICLTAYPDKKLRQIIQDSFLAIPDGFGLKIGARILGNKLKNITTGVDLCYKILNLAEQNNYSILFFEGIPPIAKLAQKVFQEKFPSLKINYLDPDKVDWQGNSANLELITEINKIKPDIILVNFGAPKQEYFINKNLDKIETKLMLGIGGSLDFIAGKVSRAPKLMRRLGLEWLWRLIKEPKRWPRILRAVLIFPLTCIKFKLTQQKN
jgi:N-acetylglucosaminyldiphosphoundecaprenol N-acetyl-beta-D-mannosaminyltransferase